MATAASTDVTEMTLVGQALVHGLTVTIFGTSITKQDFQI